MREFPPLLLLRKGSCRLGTLGHELLVLLPEGVDPINHLLDELNLNVDNEYKQCNVQMSHLSVAEPVLVGDVIGDSSLTAGLSPGASGLEAELLASKEEKNKPVLYKCTLSPGLEGGQALLGPAG